MEFEQGDRVVYRPTFDIEITGTICGIGNTGAAIIGVGYIIEIDNESKGRISDYLYSHLLGFEIHLKKIKS